MVKIPLLTEEFTFCLQNIVYLINHGLEKLKAKIFQWEMQIIQLQGRQDFYFSFISITFAPPLLEEPRDTLVQRISSISSLLLDLVWPIIT